MSTLLSFPASLIPQAHTVVATLAFSSALFIGWLSGLWVSLCKNGVAGGFVRPTLTDGRMAGGMVPISLRYVSDEPLQI